MLLLLASPGARADVDADVSFPVPKNMTTIADKLQAAGYYTAMMGKW